MRILLVLLFISFNSFGQTARQLYEIKEKYLDINSLKNDRGVLDLNDGDGYSYKSFKNGSYDDSKYMLEVYVFTYLN